MMGRYGWMVLGMFWVDGKVKWSDKKVRLGVCLVNGSIYILILVDEGNCQSFSLTAELMFV